MSLYVRLGAGSGGGGGMAGVTSLNGLTGALTLLAGTGITITPSGSNITISATGSANPYFVNEFTLSPSDITNGFVTLSPTPDNPTQVILTVINGPMQSYGTDYTVTGSQLTFGSTLAVGGASALVSGDKLVVQYN